MTRLPASIEASAFIKRAEVLGGTAVVLHKGDADRGSMLLLITERGQAVALLDRVLSMDGGYRWERQRALSESDPQQLAAYLERRRSRDPDLWVLELDIAQPERFIAETIGNG